MNSQGVALRDELFRHANYELWHAPCFSLTMSASDANRKIEFHIEDVESPLDLNHEQASFSLAVPGPLGGGRAFFWRRGAYLVSVGPEIHLPPPTSDRCLSRRAALLKRTRTLGAFSGFSTRATTHSSECASSLSRRPSPARHPDFAAKILSG